MMDVFDRDDEPDWDDDGYRNCEDCPWLIEPCEWCLLNLVPADLDLQPGVRWAAEWAEEVGPSSMIVQAFSEWDACYRWCRETKWATCIYCGDEATQNDHLVPRPVSGDEFRQIVPVVPACGSCNATLGAYADPRIELRSYRIAERLRARMRSGKYDWERGQWRLRRLEHGGAWRDQAGRSSFDPCVRTLEQEMTGDRERQRVAVASDDDPEPLAVGLSGAMRHMEPAA